MLQQSLLFRFKNGDHACLFYRTHDALRELLTPYVVEGLRNGERCFCAQKPDTNQRLLDDLRFLGIDADDAVRRGALELHTQDEVYFPQRRFEPSAMMDMLLRSVEDAAARGFTSLRTAGELSWAAHGDDECDHLIGYEQMVDECFPGKRAIGLCLYDMKEFSPATLERVLDTHRIHLSPTKPGSFHSGISVRNGNFWTEIVADKLVHRPNYYYVVQRRRPSEVLGWGIAPSFDGAHERSEQILREADR